MSGRQSATDPYDEVPYPSAPHQLSHPCHLAMLGRLFSIDAPSPGNSRVLELGSASGGNLLPMAQDLPDSQFVGIDLSARQITAGIQAIEQLGLKNIRFEHRGILDVDAGFGEFDYIICHGVYSWVGREVQDKILSLGRMHLAEHGLMYVSYNTYPGWHMRCAVRDMMNYHVAPFADIQEKIDQARALLALLVRSSQPQRQAFGNLLKEEAELLRQQGDAYLFHEHLETVNEPTYFHQFVARVEQAKLLYLGDAELPSMFVDQFDEATAQILKDASFCEQEQYMDFLRGRMFRCSILCQGGQSPDRQIQVERLRPMFVRLSESLTADPESDPGETTFLGASQQVVTSSPSLLQLLPQLIVRFPAWVAVDQLVSANLNDHWQQQSLRELTELVGRGVLLAAVDPPSLVAHVSNRPEVTPLARLQASQGEPAITTRHHLMVAADDLARFILMRLDGQQTLIDLESDIEFAIGRHELNPSANHTGGIAVADTAKTLLAERLEYFANHALLVG